MKKNLIAFLLTTVMSTVLLCGCSSSSNTSSDTQESQVESASESASGKVYKVGIVQYVDDASLDQIEQAIEAELTAKGKELGVTFDFSDYTYNGQADSSTLNQIATDLVAEPVDIIVPIATPTAMIMQTATEDNQIPVVFSAVSDPLTAGLVEDLNAPGANITGVSDAFNTDSLMDLMFAADPDIKTVGLLYNKSEDASTAAIAAAKAYCDKAGVSYIEKTGTNNDEVSLAADALVASKVDAIFTPTDNTIMTAELAIYEKFTAAKIPHYAGADSFALNGAFCGFGVNYVDLGTATADMVVDVLVNGASPATTPVMTLNNGIATVNTDVAAELSLDYSMFADKCEAVKEIKTAESFKE